MRRNVFWAADIPAERQNAFPGQALTVAGAVDAHVTTHFIKLGERFGQGPANVVKRFHRDGQPGTVKFRIFPYLDALREAPDICSNGHGMPHD